MKKNILSVVLVSLILISDCSKEFKEIANPSLKNDENAVFNYSSTGTDLTVYRGSSGISELCSISNADTIFKLIMEINTKEDTLLESDILQAFIIPFFNIEILDNAPYSAVDFLNKDDSISVNDHWSDNIFFLATTSDSIQMNIEGEKFLGIRFKMNNSYHYGWIGFGFHEYTDRMNITTHGYCYKTDMNVGIRAGQKE